MGDNFIPYHTPLTAEQVRLLLLNASPTIIDGKWNRWNTTGESWDDTGVSATGPQGPTGATGPQGPAGPKGDGPGINKNLLDNWYFAGGGSQQGGGQFPINQRGGLIIPPTSVSGATSYANADLTIPSGNINDYRIVTIVGKNASDVEYVGYVYDGTNYYTQATYAVSGYIGAGYGIDRWLVQSRVKCELTGGGVKLTNTDTNMSRSSHQKLEQFPAQGTRVTVSALTASGEFVTASAAVPASGIFAFAGGTNFSLYCDLSYGVVIRLDGGKTETFAAVKLELGSTQTLAHQENGVWVLNELPNFQQELAKCQRYQLQITPDIPGGNVIAGTGVVGAGGTYSLVFVPTPTTMRAKPTATPGGHWDITAGDTTTAATIAAVYGWSTAGVMLSVSHTALTPGTPCFLTRNTDGTILLDANL